MRPLAVLLLLALAAVPGCTFNVDWLERDILSPEEPGAYDVLQIDTTAETSPLYDVGLEVRGSELPSTTAWATVTGLLGADDDADELMRGFGIGFARRSDTTIALTAVATEAATERLWIDHAIIGLPARRDILASTGSGSIDVIGVAGRVEVVATSGSIEVEGAEEVDLSATSGSIRASAGTGYLSATSGSIALDMAGWAVATATSGSIDGHIGGGGELRATSGSIDVELTGRLDRDLTLEADSGSIRLVVPAGTPMSLDLDADSGSVLVDAGGVHHDGDAIRIDVNGGGPLVHARADSGSIDVVEAGR